MKTTPVIGQRALNPDKNFSVKPGVVVAHNQNLRTPGGKKEKLIVFSRVPYSQLAEDKSGKTKLAAKRALNILQERLKKGGLPPEKIDNLLQHMYAKVEGKLESDKNALGSDALDSLLETGKLKYGKVRFAGNDQQIPAKPVPSAPLPTTVDLPELPDVD